MAITPPFSGFHFPIIFIFHAIFISLFDIFAARLATPLLRRFSPLH